MKKTILTLLLLLIFIIPVKADDLPDGYFEQISSSGADELIQKLPRDVANLMEEWGFGDFSPRPYASLELKPVLKKLVLLIGDRADGPLAALWVVAAMTVLAALFGGVENATENLGVRQTYHTVSVLATGGLLLTPLVALLEQVREAVDSVTVFLVSFIPVYGGLLAAGGRAVSAAAYQTVLFGAIELLAQFVRAILIPLLTVSLTLGCTGALTEEFHLEAICSFFHRGILWVLGLFSTIFSGVLSIQQMAAAAGDTLSGRAVKFSLASFVPVVGGLLSEAYSTVIGCAGLLRSTVGCFGVVATVLIVLPPMLSCVCWSLCLQAGVALGGLFHLSAIEKLCGTVVATVRVLIAVLAVFALLMIVSTTVVVYMGKGV